MKKDIDLLGIHHVFFAANTFVNVVNSIGPWRCPSYQEMPYTCWRVAQSSSVVWYVKLQVLHKNGNQIRGEPLSLPSPG